MLKISSQPILFKFLNLEVKNMAVNTDTLYIKMKTENGGEAWRNVAPSVGTGEKRLNFDFSEYNIPSQLNVVGQAFVRVQTETPALTSDGEVQYKVVSEYYLTGGDMAGVIVGTDAWTDTTDEKLVVSVTNGDQDGTAKMPRAATALGAGSTGSYVDAVRAYSQAVATYYNIGDNTSSVTWTQTHLTGTKDTLVARNS